MSIYSIAEQTYVDGRLYYSIVGDQKSRERNFKERSRLIQKMLSEKKESGDSQKIIPERSFLFHCNDESYSY